MGYAVAIAVNGVLVWAVGNLVEWDLLPFLTADFDRAVPLIRLSLQASILVNAVWLVSDPPWFRSVGQIGLDVVSLAALIRLHSVFPFEFAEGGFDWGTATRVFLVVAMLGLGVGTVVEGVKLIRSLAVPAPD